jgi:hypothetical protein
VGIQKVYDRACINGDFHAGPPARHEKHKFR